MADHTCANCGSPNPDGQKFCGECGTALIAVCSNGHPNSPDQKFCGECGVALAGPATASAAPTPPSEEPGQRRFVSVLFADLVGFTTFSESRDPEEVRGMLTRYFDRSRQVIESFGGEVDKFIGDAVTAFWGAKTAQEDDAERAVRAALELVDAVEALGEELGIPELAVRAGVLSGETAVGAGGNETGMVVGDIVNTASRLQSAAQPGTVYVGDTTKQLTEAAVRYQPVGEQDMKGKSVPVMAWRAHSVVGERGGRNRWGVLEPPFVARTDELRMLKDQLHGTTRDGSARLVSIVGEAGIGKSRLGWELLKYLDGLSETFRWHQGRSPAYGDGVTFWALTEMVRSRAGIAEGDETLKARTKLRTVVAEFVSDVEEQQWIEPRLAGLLGLDEMPSGERDELFAAIRTFLQRVASNETAVLLFEDLHWADSGLLDFIEQLIEHSRNHPILVITLARPELLERRPTWGTIGHRFLSMRLGPLSNPEMADLVRGMAPDLSGDVVEAIVARAGGVPLYAVEYVRMLVNSGDLVVDGDVYRQARTVADLALPDSLYSMIGARIDRLDQALRSLLQDAAVLGQSFSIEGLTVLTGRPAGDLEGSLRSLVNQELLRFEADPRSPERGQYQFVQGVIQEVAYGRIAKADRKDRHVKVAEYYESESPVEAAVVIASHYLNAYEAGLEEELADRARAALMNAAGRAVELRSHEQALSLVEQALEVPGSERQQASLWEFAARAAGPIFRHDQAVEYARKALDWYERNSSDADTVRAARVLGFTLIEADEPIEAIDAMTPHFDAAAADDAEMMELGATLAGALMRASRMQESADLALTVYMAAEAGGHVRLMINALTTRGTALASLGRIHESGALLRESLRLGEEHGLELDTLRALNNLEVIEAIDGIGAIRDGWKRGYELSLRLREGSLLARMTGNHAQGLFEAGRVDDALELLNGLDLRGSVWEAFFGVSRNLFLWYRNGDPAHIEAAREANRPGLDHNEPQYRDYSRDSEAYLAWISGDLDGVVTHMRRIETLHPYLFVWHHGLMTAIRLRDAALAREVIDLIPNGVGRRFELLREMGAAVVELLEGDRERAARRFADCAERLEEVESERFAMEWRAVFAEAMPERPEAQEAARRAYAWFTEAGMNGPLALFAESWNAIPAEEAVAG
jgi:class 3 adenylate cyclase/tetratricopeptide (TPR) repeat protein